MACTNRWDRPGNRWRCGSGWATTGVIRPVTEIQCGVDLAVRRFHRSAGRVVFVDAMLADQAARGAVRGHTAVVDLAGWVPAIRHDQLAAVLAGFVAELSARARRVTLTGIHSVPGACQSGLQAVPSRRRTYNGDDEKGGDVGAASQSSADRFGSMAELSLFRRPRVMRRSNCRQPGGDRRR